MNSQQVIILLIVVRVIEYVSSVYENRIGASSELSTALGVLGLFIMIGLLWL
jgi:hypothetical protein